ncbi:hypothetical protein [Streptomyces sp. NPDC050485]|uniref:hypothetical protein n=1 Tax=Streptomyces sp. NPDC050485 TaxID=3365617 RepID=UPI0037B1CB37
MTGHDGAGDFTRYDVHAVREHRRPNDVELAVPPVRSCPGHSALAGDAAVHAALALPT